MMVSSEDNTPTGFVVRHKVSLRQRLAGPESRAETFRSVFFIAALIAGILWLGGTAAVMFTAVLFIGFCVTELLLPHAAASKRIKLLDLQTTMAKGLSTDLYADTQTLVQGYMALKEFSAAEHYSALLLKQSGLPPEQRQSKLQDLIAASDCWLSTKEYHRSWTYALLWNFETRGRLSLDNQCLGFESQSISVRIDLADITCVEIRHHRWCLHMAPCKYLLLAFNDRGKQRQLCLSPTSSDRINVWYVNKGVEQWCELINIAKHKRGINRVVDSMRAQIVDVESNTGQTKV